MGSKRRRQSRDKSGTAAQPGHPVPVKEREVQHRALDQSSQNTGLSSKKRFRLWDFVPLCALVISLASLLVSCNSLSTSKNSLEWSQQSWQLSGPQYSLYGLEAITTDNDNLTEPMTSQTYEPFIISNDGRTAGTVVDITRDSEYSEYIQICTPKQSSTESQSETPLGTVTFLFQEGIRLEPGETRVAFFVLPTQTVGEGETGTIRSSFSHFLTVHLANGARLSRKIDYDMSQQAKAHYTNQIGYEPAKQACRNAVDELVTDKLAGSPPLPDTS